MPDFVTEIAKTAVPILLVAIITAVLTVRLSIRQFHEEKWWEKKQEAYSNLLEVLHKLKNYAKQHFDRY